VLILTISIAQPLADMGINRHNQTGGPSHPGPDAAIPTSPSPAVRGKVPEGRMGALIRAGAPEPDADVHDGWIGPAAMRAAQVVGIEVAP
jgi:hypothetical protein